MLLRFRSAKTRFFIRSFSPGYNGFGGNPERAGHTIAFLMSRPFRAYATRGIKIPGFRPGLVCRALSGLPQIRCNQFFSNLIFVLFDLGRPSNRTGRFHESNGPIGQGSQNLVFVLFNLGSLATPY